ncbi:NAD-dependent epimerase/dehydratase family protein [Aquimarina sp. SS2-1]|uniref:NAD-dependent epimerase/dehydratase family protein n=1 Tax=Aquimarina besae TaxID=3342247 RepID=UPI003671DB49
MKIAIVGSNSFLAQALLVELSSRYDDVIQVYHQRSYRLSNKFRQIRINEFLEQKPVVDCIFYITSHISFKESLEEINEIYKVNVYLLKTISKIFQNAKIIHASSVALYENSGKIITEESAVNPKNSYGISKLWAELIVKNHKGGGINVRISSLFGERMNRGTFLPEIIISAISKKEICLYGDGSRMQNYVYVKDVAEILEKAMQKKTNIPLLAVGNRSYSNYEVATMIKDFLPDVSIVYKKEDASRSFFYDNSSTNKILGINRTNIFKEQLRQTALWIQKQY